MSWVRDWVMDIKVTKYECGCGAGGEGLARYQTPAGVPGDIVEVEYTEVGVIDP